MTSNSKRVLATAALAGMLALGFAGGQAWTAVAAAADARGQTITPLAEQKLANIPGKTLAAPVYVYQQIESQNQRGASAISLLLLALSFSTMLVVEWIYRRRGGNVHVTG